MNYRINVFKVKNDECNVKAYANVAFGDAFVVKNIAIVQKKDGSGLFVDMPSYRSNDVDEYGDPIYNSIANPITKEFNKELTSSILQAYEQRSELGKDGLKVGDGNGEPSFSVAVSVFDRDGSNTKGLARMYINDSFVVQNISIVEGKNGLFVSMPAYKNGRGAYQDIAFPITKDFRSKLYGEILDTYKIEREKPLDASLSKDDGFKDMDILDTGSKEELPFR
jgi:DNA-binding cell septation regulator SpoVG